MSIPTHSGDGLTLGPVQMLIVGFQGDNFDGSIMKELDRLKEHDIVRLVDLLFVKKNDDGEIEVVQRSDLDAEEAQEFGAIVGALVGFGADDEEGAEFGAIAGAAELEDGHLFDDAAVWYLGDAIPEGTAAAVALLEHRWRYRCVTRSRRPAGSRFPTRGSTRPISLRRVPLPQQRPEPQPAAWGVMPHAAACSSPGSRTTSPSPLAKALGAQVIGSTATLLRAPSGSESPVKTIRYG